MRSFKSFRRLMPYAVVALAICIAAIWAPFFFGCAAAGACVGVGGVVDECFQNWSRSECSDYNSLGINGSNWTFYPGSDCSDLGFTLNCGGYYKYPGTGC